MTRIEIGESAAGTEGAVQAKQKKRLVVNTLTALLGGDAASVEADIAPDMRWITPKSLGQAETHTRAAFLEIVGSLKTIFPKGLTLNISRTFCDGDDVIVEYDYSAEGASGQMYQNDYCAVFTVSDGKISSIREYNDSLKVAEFFKT